MEKASKKVAEVEVEMQDGTKKNLATLTQADFPKVKLDSDKGINLKRGIVSDDGQTYVERRFFKRSNNDKIVLFDLSLPLTETAFNKLSFEERQGNYVKGKRISADAEQIGGEALDEATKNFIALTKKVAKGEKLTADEKKAMATYYANLVKK